MMNRLILCVCTIVTLGCAKTAVVDEPSEDVASQEAKSERQPAVEKKDSGSPGKPRAPIDIKLDISEGATVVHVLPKADTESLTIVVTAGDGLKIEGEKLERILGARASGRGIDVPVVVLGATPHGRLTVTVEGEFNGLKRVAIESFPLGGSKVQEETGAVDSPLGPIMPAGN